MKIAVIHQGIFPDRFANRVHVINTCYSFSKNHDVELFSYYISNPKTASDILSYYGINANFSITQIKLLNIKFIRGLFKLLIFPLIALKKARKADVVYTRSAIIALLSTWKKQACILELHTPIQLANPKLTKLGLFNALFSNPYLKKLVAISQPILDDMSHLPIPKNKCLVYPDAVNIEHFTPQKKSPLTSSSTLVYCGSFTTGRGLELILELAKLMPQNNVIMYGGKPHEIEEKKQACSDLKNIEFRGFLEHKDVPKALSEADILLAPYQKKIQLSVTVDTGKYASPLKLFEYMATGIPIICSDTPVLREVMKHKENCMLASPTDVKEWQAAVEALQNSDELRTTISQNAIQEATNTYNWDTRCKKILENL